MNLDDGQAEEASQFADERPEEESPAPRLADDAPDHAGFADAGGDQGLPEDDYDEQGDEGISLEELSQSYAQVLSLAGSEPSADVGNEAEPELALFDDEPDQEVDPCPVTPLSILESILFVGRPDNSSISAKEIASLIRGVSEAEVASLVEQLNATYEETNRAVRIQEHSDGYQAALADEMEFVRERFYGRAREVKLNQAAVDCLALIAYQPGISRTDLDDQRGQPSGGVLNQLVRRQLVEIKRVGEGRQSTPHYYPTPKLLELAGLDSLDDLPQVEEF